MIETGWTPEALLDEGKRLLENYDHAKTQEEKDRINGCFVAVQEVLLARSVMGFTVEWPTHQNYQLFICA